MKDLRRWGPALITVVLIASMTSSMALSATASSRRLPDRLLEGTDSPLVDAVGEPDWGGNRAHFVPSTLLVLNISLSARAIGLPLPFGRIGLSAREVRRVIVKHGTEK